MKMKRTKRTYAVIAGAGLAIILVAAVGGCAEGSGGGGGLAAGFSDTLREVGSIFGRSDVVDENLGRAESALAVADKASKLAPLGPREEYYLGRAVAANVIDRYGVYRDDATTRYLNLVGQSIALSSAEPSTWGGYRFIILDTDEINAVSAPGGFVMVTRGMLGRCRSEHAVAAVLAHEIAHVQERHGVDLVERQRGQEFLATVAQEAVKNFGDRDVAQLSQALSTFVDDFLLNLLDKGYERSLEFESDHLAQTLMADAGYDPNGLRDVLDELARSPAGGKGWFSTHPDPRDRLARIDSGIPRAATSGVRDRRFRAAMASVGSP